MSSNRCWGTNILGGVVFVSIVAFFSSTCFQLMLRLVLMQALHRRVNHWLVMTRFCIFLAHSCRVKRCTLFRACQSVFVVRLSVFLWNWRLVAWLFIACVLIPSSLRIIYSFRGATVVQTWQLYIIDSLQVRVLIILTSIYVETIGQVAAQVAWITAIVNLLRFLISIYGAYHDRGILPSILCAISWV
jgi:hypothetical protein